LNLILVLNRAGGTTARPGTHGLDRSLGARHPAQVQRQRELTTDPHFSILAVGPPGNTGVSPLPNAAKSTTVPIPHTSQTRAMR